MRTPADWFGIIRSLLCYSDNTSTTRCLSTVTLGVTLGVAVGVTVVVTLRLRRPLHSLGLFVRLRRSRDFRTDLRGRAASHSGLGGLARAAALPHECLRRLPHRRRVPGRHAAMGLGEWQRGCKGGAAGARSGAQPTVQLDRAVAEREDRVVVPLGGGWGCGVMGGVRLIGLG